MKRLVLMIFSALICGMVLTGCNSKTESGDEVFYKATVLGIGMDCKIILIKFDEGVPNLPVSTVKNVYHAHNLLEEYQIEGKRIEVQLGFFKEPIAIACTAMGPAYGHVYIAKVR